MEDTKGVARRRHGDELKRQVLAECESVAKVALAHGLNANVHKWRRLSGHAAVQAAQRNAISTFIPVPLPVIPAQPGGDICIELRRGALAVNVTWPLNSSAECAAWLRELLR